ncbi:MAG: alpha/beta hydrolase [Rhodospirillales bacterium]
MLFDVLGHQAYAYTANHAIDPAKPTVVFIHGAGNDHAVWALQSRYFAYHGRNLLAVDLPGHGRSHGLPLAGIAEMADWIMALLEAAGVARAALVGHSMGSLISLNAAARFPDRIEKIALIGTVVPMQVSPALLETSEKKEHDAFDMINIWGHAPGSWLGGNTVPGAWMMGSNLRLLERTAPGTLHRDFVACNAYATGLADAAEVKCPALLILGARDQMTPPRRARDLMAKIPGARTVILDSAGHALMAEEPDRVLDELIGFL